MFASTSHEPGEGGTDLQPWARKSSHGWSCYPAPQVASKSSKPAWFVQKQNSWPFLHPLPPVPPAQAVLCQRNKAGGEVRNISSSKGISNNISRGQAPAPGLSEFVLSWGNFSVP